MTNDECDNVNGVDILDKEAQIMQALQISIIPDPKFFSVSSLTLIVFLNFFNTNRLF